MDECLKAGMVGWSKHIGETPPRIHDLVRMAKMAEIEFDEDTL